MRSRRPDGVVAGAVFLAALAWMSAFDGWTMGSRVPAVGMPAEDFQLVDLDGKRHSLSEYRGKIVLLDFWATWCKPCTIEMPVMQACYEKMHDQGFVVLAVNELEDDARVRDHIRQYGHTFPVLMDRDNTVANQFGVFGLPVSVFIDEQGVVQEYIKGGLLNEQRITDIVTRIHNGDSKHGSSKGEKSG